LRNAVNECLIARVLRPLRVDQSLMDFDVLNRVGDVMKRCVVAQDTTEMWELQEPNCELRGFQSETGDFFENAAAKGAPAMVVKGSHNVGRCTAKVFAWLQQGSCIAQPAVDAEVKRRKVVANGNAAGAPSNNASAAMALGGSGSPRRPQSALLADAPADPATFSTVTVTYGRPTFPITDVLYVSEEGKIALITRRLSDAPTDVKLLAQWQQDRASFFFKAKQTVNAPVVRAPVLDFTFCGLAEATDMLRVSPATGKRHRAAPIESRKDTDAAHSDFQQVGAGKGAKTLIKARNREGDEEVYEFNVDTDQRFPDGIVNPNGPVDPRQAEDDRLRKLASELRGKYVADAVRASSNSIQDGSQIVKVLRNLVANYYMSISWLDLSCNRLILVPDNLASLPLTTLYLHSNHISSWTEVEKLKQLKSLTAVTLFGNEIATQTEEYKSVALSMLLSVKGKLTPLKSLDFVALTAVDKELTAHHLRRNKGSPLRSPRRNAANDTVPLSPRK
jgi:hypothetical protein